VSTYSEFAQRLAREMGEYHAALQAESLPSAIIAQMLLAWHGARLRQRFGPSSGPVGGTDEE
jgi:hypothetical protein